MLKQYFNLILVRRFFFGEKRYILLFLDERLEDFILTKLDQKATNKSNIYEQLGYSMCEAGNDFGPSTQYGNKRIDLFHFFSLGFFFRLLLSRFSID